MGFAFTVAMPTKGGKMKPHEELERYKKLRSITASRTDNIYELTRMRIVRVMRECEEVSYAA